MEIRVLRYFFTVVREGGINRAAEALHITQPTLSRQLSQLEEDVGVRLFHRGSRKIMLTNEGILLRRRRRKSCLWLIGQRRGWLILVCCWNPSIPPNLILSA